MTKVIEGELTGKVHARTLVPGDVIWRDGERFEVTGNIQHSLTVKLTLRDAFGILRFPPWTSINTPIDRVTGARSAGQIQ